MKKAYVFCKKWCILYEATSGWNLRARALRDPCAGKLGGGRAGGGGGVGVPSPKLCAG